jgi:chorismate synthase
MLTYLTAGESHGPQLTAIIDGLPAGLTIDPAAIDYQLQRRQKGYGRGGRMQIEKDSVRIASGLRHGRTLGGPVTLVIENADWPSWSRIMDPIKAPPAEYTDQEREAASRGVLPRPGHADLAGGIKHGHHDLRNVLERASARETAARVALGALARQLLESFGVVFASHVVRIGRVTLPAKLDRPDLGLLSRLAEASEVRCIDEATGRQMMVAIDEAREKQDSVGGMAEILISGLPVGLGGFSQWDRRLDGRLAAALMAIPSAKAVEIGLGLEAATRFGSAVHDVIEYDPSGDPSRKGFSRRSNNAGGIEGGMTNGEDVVVRVAAKPISTLSRPLATVDVTSKQPAEAMTERADTCVVPAVAVIGEAVAALVFAEAFLEKFGADNFEETERNYRSFLETPY